MTSLHEVRVEAAHPAFAGHFPGAPVWPGVLLLAEAFEALKADPERSRRLGAAPQIASAKFLAPVRPGDVLQVRLSDTVSGVAFELWRGDTLAARGELR